MKRLLARIFNWFGDRSRRREQITVSPEVEEMFREEKFRRARMYGF